ncbi:MAG: RdgB/HAM1 family non-canonical purine NTP pyrophosphatase [Cyclobacteriaceae bacterium]|nr:RdgB/HAM1 family non-canonical purine NTP pyrophosphatase [Cyclobacteriaceae bacterium]
MKTIVFATNNRHKLEEVRQLLDSPLQVHSLAEIGCVEELPETQNTLEGNALQKAQYVFEKFKTPCFADDTGLEVDALKGEPGVYSARFAGEHKSSDDNINLLLEKLKGQSNRQAQFRCIIVLVEEKGVKFFDGILQGEIIQERLGAGGFGYDPVFLPTGSDKTLAQMTMEEKNAISHRGIAVRKLVQYLKKNYAR